jgi:DNA-directed RNA polymerase subunit E'/Rpb7
MATKTKPTAMSSKPKPSIFKPSYIDQRVTLKPSELRDAAGDIDKFLTEKLRKRLEGICCTHGYVQPGSTEILARSMGQAEHGRFTADFVYNCKVKISCFLPFADQVITARIQKMNRLGAYALVYEAGRVLEAMRVLIPRDLHLGNAEFDGLQVGQGIKVRLLQSRFQVNDTFIQAVGKYEGRVVAADQREKVPKAEAEAEAEAAAEEEVEEEPVVEAPPGGVEGVLEKKESD